MAGTAQVSLHLSYLVSVYRGFALWGVRGAVHSLNPFPCPGSCLKAHFLVRELFQESFPFLLFIYFFLLARQKAAVSVVLWGVEGSWGPPGVFSQPLFCRSSARQWSRVANTHLSQKTGFPLGLMASPPSASTAQTNSFLIYPGRPHL